MVSSTAGGDEGFKKNRENKKAPVFAPSCVTPVGLNLNRQKYAAVWGKAAAEGTSPLNSLQNEAHVSP